MCSATSRLLRKCAFARSNRCNATSASSQPSSTDLKVQRLSIPKTHLTFSSSIANTLHSHSPYSYLAERKASQHVSRDHQTSTIAHHLALIQLNLHVIYLADKVS